METVRVIYHREVGAWWAESPDVDGWSSAGDSYAEVAGLAKEGIPFALARDDFALEHFVPVGPWFEGRG
jgi:predicted RNase H-like HicB family nuclease